MFRAVRLAVASLVLGFAFPAFSATIYDCSKSQKRCIIRLAEGGVDDKVRILDASANLVANAKIIKRPVGSAYAVVQITGKPSKRVQKNFPVIVIVDTKDSTGSWAPHNYKRR